MFSNEDNNPDKSNYSSLKFKKILLSKEFLGVMVLSAFCCFFRLGSITLFDLDESIFAKATKEMLNSGNWLTPTYNGINRYDKPILLYWCMGASYKVFGVNEFASRFPSAFSGVLLAAALFIFLSLLHNRKGAWYGTLILSLSVYYLVYSHAAVTDMILTLCITLSLFSFYLFTCMEGNLSKYIYGFYFFAALAFLTKGLVGILFPFGIAFLYLLFLKEWTKVKRLFTHKGIFLFIAVSMPWYLIQCILNGKAFIDQFFLKDHFLRYKTPDSGHGGPFYYYIVALLIGLFPYIAFIPQGIAQAIREKNRLFCFALLWVGVVLLFFSFSATKLPNYILPVLAPTAMLIALGMDAEPQRQKYSHGFIAIASLLLSLLLIFSEKHLPRIGITDTGWTTILIATTHLGLAVSAVYTIIRKQTYNTSLFFFMFCMLMILVLNIAPLVNRYLQGTLLSYSLQAKEMLTPGEKIITYHLNNPSIGFYSGFEMERIQNREELLNLLKSKKHLVAITRSKGVVELKNLGFNLIEEDDHYAFLEKKS